LGYGNKVSRGRQCTKSGALGQYRILCWSMPRGRDGSERTRAKPNNSLRWRRFLSANSSRDQHDDSSGPESHYVSSTCLFEKFRLTEIASSSVTRATRSNVSSMAWTPSTTIFKNGSTRIFSRSLGPTPINRKPIRSERRRKQMPSSKTKTSHRPHTYR